jgi:hypothetical protein
MTDTPTPHRATPEQWEHLENGALIDRPYNSARVVLELRDRIIHLEQQHETAKACTLEIYERLDKLKLQHESNWSRIVKLEEARGSDTLAALEQRVQALEARPQTPAEIDEGMRQAFREAIADGVVHPVPPAPAPSAEPAPPELGPEWKPCVKLPIVVHVREQRPGEQHVSTREGITPLKEDDLIMRGVQGEEYPIGRELFMQTYHLGTELPQTPAPSAEPAPDTDSPIYGDGYIILPPPAAEPAPEALIDPVDDIVDAEGKPWDRTMDGALWAKAFCRRFGGDEGLMLGWFCNAIMAGWDHAHWKMEADAQSAPAPRRQLPGPQQIAECGGPCETIGPEACDCGQFPPLPAPAGSLVEAVKPATDKELRALMEDFAGGFELHLLKKSSDCIPIENWVAAARVIYNRGREDAAVADPPSPPPSPAGSLAKVVAALIANGIACDREEERIAADVIAAVAKALLAWHYSDELLRTAWEAAKWLEREAGR